MHLEIKKLKMHEILLEYLYNTVCHWTFCINLLPMHEAINCKKNDVFFPSGSFLLFYLNVLYKVQKRSIVIIQQNYSDHYLHEVNSWAGDFLW